MPEAYSVYERFDANLADRVLEAREHLDMNIGPVLPGLVKRRRLCVLLPKGCVLGPFDTEAKAQAFITRYCWGAGTVRPLGPG